MDWKITLADLDLGPEEEEAVLAVLRSRWLTSGEVTQRFEQAFAEYIGVKHAIAVANCTVGLHLACLACGIGPGDEVIVPSLTFVATAAAVLHAGATPVFADIQSDDDLTISPAHIAECITERTRAILPMHYGGYACNMPEIMQLAEAHNLVVIEDAAHAPGAALDGRNLGAWGKVGVFSFFSNKNLATGEGGMLVTEDDESARQLRLLRSHAMTSLTWDRHRGHAWSYDVVDLGYNYRMDELRAAIGLAQLGKLDRNNEKRRALTRLYHQALRQEAPQAFLPFAGHRGKSAAHIFPMLLPSATNRLEFMAQMKARGIQTSIHYPPIHSFSYYRQRLPLRHALPITEAVAAREVTLPLHPLMDEAQVIEVTTAVGESLRLAGGKA